MTDSTGALDHFSKRAKTYNRSANWISDPVLVEKIRQLAEAGPQAQVLDLATGTGQVAKAFKGRVAKVIGFDLCPSMTQEAGTVWDQLVMGKAEELPFEDETFDACVCRQGLQFMDLDAVLPQIVRVLKPGGRVVFCHLTAYGPEDRETSFLIQKLRNPARRNFFLPGDFPALLERHGFTGIETVDYISRESVDQWIDNGAINAGSMELIRRAYRDSSDEFKKIHSLEFQDGDIFDVFKMPIVKGLK